MPSHPAAGNALETMRISAIAGRFYTRRPSGTKHQCRICRIGLSLPNQILDRYAYNAEPKTSFWHQRPASQTWVTCSPDHPFQQLYRSHAGNPTTRPSAPPLARATLRRLSEEVFMLRAILGSAFRLSTLIPASPCARPTAPTHPPPAI